MNIYVIIISAVSLLLVNCSNPPEIEPEHTSNPIPVTITDSTAVMNLQSEDEPVINIEQDLRDKIKVLEYRTRYLDSVYFELAATMTTARKDIDELKSVTTKKLVNQSSVMTQNQVNISDNEFRQRYIDALANFQNGEYDIALNIFSQLIEIDRKHELSDNCQYWIGEIYYARKEFRKALTAFQDVLDYAGANKADHAQFKIGLCYINLNEMEKAKNAFKLHMERYPASDQYSTSKKYVENIK